MVQGEAQEGVVETDVQVLVWGGEEVGGGGGGRREEGRREGEGGGGREMGVVSGAEFRKVGGYLHVVAL